MIKTTQTSQTLQQNSFLPNLNIQLEFMPKIGEKYWFLFCAVFEEIHRGPKQIPYADIAKKVRRSVDWVQDGIAHIEKTLALVVKRVKITWNRNAPNIYSLGELVMKLLNRRQVTAEKIKADKDLKALKAPPLAQRVYEGAGKIIKEKAAYIVLLERKLSSLMRERHDLKAINWSLQRNQCGKYDPLRIAARASIPVGDTTLDAQGKRELEELRAWGRRQK